MGEVTKISWTDHTFNPWIGCTRVSPGCTQCYAEQLATTRLGVQWGPQATRKVTVNGTWAQPKRWNRAALRDGVRRKVFCASLSDVFEDKDELVEPRARLFRLIEECTQLDWLLLTKRPEDMQRLATPAGWTDWPPHVWAGCTVESQEYARKRLPDLLQVPSPIHFISYEPALGPIDLRMACDGSWHDKEGANAYDALTGTAFWSNADPGIGGGPKLDWVIIGGESGSKARAFNLRWARQVLRDCLETGVAPFMKQLGSNPVGGWLSNDGNSVTFLPIPAQVLDWQWGPWPEKLHAKGGEPDEWPEDLRVRQFPTPTLCTVHDDCRANRSVAMACLQAAWRARHPR